METVFIRGRAVTCALGDDIESARRLAYQAVSKISFEGMQYRKDIASDVT